MSVNSGVSQFSPRIQRKINAALSGQAGLNQTSISITNSEVSLQANTTGELSEIIDVRVPAGYVYAFPATVGIQMYLMTHEQFTSNTTGGADETYELSNDLVKSPTTTDADTSQASTGAEVDSGGHRDLVVYDEGTQKAVVSVDYDDNEFVYANAEDSADTLDAYYLWGDSSEIEARTYIDNFEAHQTVMGSTASNFHRANTYSQAQKVTFRNQFALDSKEHLKFMINTDVDLENWNDVSGNGPNSTSSYSSFQLPVYKIKK